MKIIIQDCSHNSAGLLRIGCEDVSRPDQTLGARHIALIKNPGNKKKRLFLGRSLYAYITEMSIKESEEFLDEVWKYLITDKVTLNHKYSVGNLLIWKNLYVLYKKDLFDHNTKRIMRRTQIKGNTNLN